MLIKILQFLPVIIFFVSYKTTSDLILATSLIIGSVLVCSALEYLVTKTVSRLQIFMIAAVLVFGIPTVLLKDPNFIKLKISIVNLLLALAIFVFQVILKKNPFAYLLKKDLPIPDSAYALLSKMWMIFFVFAAGLNIIIAFYLPELFGVSQLSAENLWVDYKTFGNAILNVVFTLFCGLIIYKKYPEALNDKLNNKNQQ
ncbi:septation protein IspZ [Succinivibrio faecicola]|uniref:Inner membrane-spanning protein YciB n=1 Tax=Succinivibrio faecicola TaxID=2820300 RepID=A0ABS7DJ25_9GAMM|nr:septation protein IspZ [Succinivibrio faecicola]MBW7571109.1 septation protein IspZ [Succinivibrio faecicola]